MRITALVENTTKGELKAKHGLSFYIETKRHQILFDLGPDDTLFENAREQGIDLLKIDTVIISHGHTNHGGALDKFLKINPSARVYVQRKAFEPHFLKICFMKIPLGLNEKLQSHPQIILVEGDYKIDDELCLLTVEKTEKCYSDANDVLFDRNGKDDFSHEQNLVITENETVLLMGCGHTGVVNIMEKAESLKPKVCVGGFHLFNPITKRSVSDSLLEEIAQKLQAYGDTRFYTCHCTGKKAFEYLEKKASNVSYLSCGESIEI